MVNIFIGLCLLSLGIIGVVSSWWAVVDFVIVFIPVLLVVVGVISILGGLESRRGTVRKQ